MNKTNIIIEYLSKIDTDIAERKATIQKYNDEIVELESLRNKITSKNVGDACIIKTTKTSFSPQAERQRKVREANAIKVDEFLSQNKGIASTTTIANEIGLSRMATLKLLKKENFTPLSKGNWGARNKEI